MKKEDVSGIIVYVLILALAVVFGITVLRQHAESSGLEFGIYFLYIIGAIVSGVLLNAILFEVAHRVGAKAGGYEVVSVNVLGVLRYKENGKVHYKFSGYDGLTGETKILPKKDRKKEPNPTPYLLFGTLFYLIELIIVVVLFVILNQDSTNKPLVNIGYFLLVILAIGGMILIYNILPFKLDTTTDGYRLRTTSNAANKKAFNELLRVEHAVNNGEADVEINTFSEITNYTADLNLNKVYVLLDKREFQEAEKLLDIIIAKPENISSKVFARARAQKIYINIMTKSLEEAKQFYDANVNMAERRLISNDLSMVSIRTYLLMSGLLDKSRSECMIAINNVQKCFRKTPKQRQQTEIELFNEAINKVNEVHPDWQLTDYILKPIEEKNKNK